MAFTRRATSIGWILLSGVVTGAGLDAPVTSQMRLAVPGTDQVRVIARVQAGSELDLVATLAGSKDWPPGEGPSLWWTYKRTLGIFLQHRNRAGIVYKIAVQPGPPDCAARVERATPTDLVVSCTPEKGNLRGPNHKFVYDIRSKALTGQLEYQPFSMPRLFISRQTAVLVGSDRRQLIALQFDPAREGPFSLIK